MSQLHRLAGRLIKPVLRTSTLVAAAVALSACVATPDDTSVTSSQITLTSSSANSSSSEAASSSLPPVIPSSQPVSSSSAAVSSSVAPPSSSSAPPSSSSSLVASSSSVSSSSSSEAGPPMVSCELVAETNNGNNFEVETFRIINSDARPVDSWKITIDVGSANLNSAVQTVYSDAAEQVELATVSRDGKKLIIEGGVIDAMSTQNIFGFDMDSPGLQEVPECQLEVIVEGYDPNGNSGLNGPGWQAVSQEELDAYFVDYPCGVNYTALGNGGWPACFRTEDGHAVCYANGQSRTLQWDSDKTPVEDVLHVSGMDSDYAVVVLEDGSAYQVKTDIGIRDGDLIVDSGAIAVSAGFQTRACLMIDAGDKRDLLCTEEKNPWERPDLPEDFDVVQLSSSYKMNCALNVKGQAWCWGHPDAASDVITSTPAQIPFDEPVVNISADQTTLCGVSYTGAPKCITDGFVPGYVPEGEPIPGSGSGKYLAEGFEPDAAFFHGAYNRGVVVRKDGTGFYYTKEIADSGEGTPLGLTDIIAGGGKRDSIVVMTADGNIHSVNGGSSSLVEGYKAQNPTCPIQ